MISKHAGFPLNSNFQNRMIYSRLGRAELATIGKGSTAPQLKRGWIIRKANSESQEQANSERLFDGANNVRSIGLNEAEKLYLSLPERTNCKHVLLVMHMPNCSYCKNMESEVKRLASGLKSEAKNLTIVSLDCSEPATRSFVKNVLGVPALPAFCAFPQRSRTFYKFKGSSRDADSLLKFLNMVCNQNEAKIWKIPEPVAVVLKAPEATAAPKTKEKTVSKVEELPPVSTVANAPSSKANLVTSNTFSMGFSFVAGLALFAGVSYLVRGYLRKKDEPSPENGGVPAVGGETRPVDQLLNDIDKTLGRMGSVMLKLVRARVGLVIAPVDDPLPNHVALPGQSQAVDDEAQTSSSPSGPSGGGMRRGAPTVAAAIAVPTSATALDALPRVIDHIQGQGQEWPYSPGAFSDPLLLKSANMPSSASTSQILDHNIQKLNVSGISPEQMLALLEEEGDDVEKAIQRLMQQQGVQFNVRGTPSSEGSNRG